MISTWISSPADCADRPRPHGLRRTGRWPSQPQRAVDSRRRWAGGAAGGFLGALAPGFDLTGGPEILGAEGGAAAGGWVGGEIGSGIAGLIPNF